MAHLLVDDAMVGPGGGERELHMAMGIYGVRPEALPTAAQYVALGHVHKNQEVRCGTKAAYSGSLLQLDFGEREQEKYVNLVEIHAKQPAQVTQLPITAGRKLIDIGSPVKGVNLNELSQYAEQGADAWYRVFIDLDIPVANLAADGAGGAAHGGARRARKGIRRGVRCAGDDGAPGTGGDVHALLREQSGPRALAVARNAGAVPQAADRGGTCAL